MPSWKKVITSGSDAALNSLNVTTSLTASGLIYPTVDGISGQVIQTDGAGNLSFSNVEYTAISIKNVSGVTIAKGTPCYITGSGTSGNIAGVWPADASNPLRMPAGVIAGETLNNGDEGLGLINGFINGVNTSAFAAGDSVYVAAGGGYTNIRPTGSAILVQKLGNVEKSALNGSGVINGPGYYNDLPNIQQGYTWVGNADGVAIAIATSSIQNVISASYAATSSYATQFNVATGLTASGLIYPIADNGNESYIQTDGAGNLSLQYVKSMYETVRNRETSSIISGIPLFVSGATGANSDVYIADASNPARMPATYIASETIAPSGTGKALISGLLTNINTTAYQAGQELFVNTGSGLTTSRPPYPNSVQLLGIVTRIGINGQAVILNPGQIEIQNIQPGYTLVGNSIGTPTAVATSSLSVASASFASTASYVNTLNQTVIISGSVAIGTSSLGPSENTLTLGARNAASEGGQIGFNAPGGTYTSASFMDNWQNKARILKGNNTTSTGLIAQWDIHTTQMQLAGYTAASSFPGTATANLAVDSGGNVITVSTSGGTVFPYTGNAVITGSLTATTGFIAPNTNGAMYLRGGDDVELWDINISNHLGVYGQQDSTVASVKLGSGGGVISGKSGNIGIGTINPTANLDVIGTTRISGSLGVTGSLYITGSATLINEGPTVLSGSFKVQGAGNGFVGPFAAIEIDDVNFSRKLFDFDTGSGSLDFSARQLLDRYGTTAIEWTGTSGTYISNLYGAHRISSGVRDKLYTNNDYSGQILLDVYFDINVQDNDLVYLGNSGEWAPAEQNNAAATKMLGIAKEIFNQTGSVLIEGDLVVTTTGGYPIVSNAGYGSPVYMKQGTGTQMDTTIPVNGYVRLLGYCYASYNAGNDWIMKFRPSNEWVEL